MIPNLTLPDLEDRFLPPQSWESRKFINPNTGHEIHYSTATPENKTPTGTIVILPGLSEFTEKYIETARYFLDQGFEIYAIDWAYQGRSFRFEANNQKRHSDGFDSDVSDLHHLITNEIKSDLPLYMLAHSMGAHIGLRYMSKHQNIFKAASLSAPMQGMQDIKYALPIVRVILSLLKNKDNLYIPFGKDWHEEARQGEKHDIFSNDPVRKEIHNIWNLTNPILKVGNPTLRWLGESIKSIAFLTASKLEEIKTPMIIFLSGREKIVDNAAIIKTAKHIPNAELITFPTAKHEIWMETDDIRDSALQETLALFKQPT